MQHRGCLFGVGERQPSCTGSTAQVCFLSSDEVLDYDPSSHLRDASPIMEHSLGFEGQSSESTKPLHGGIMATRALPRDNACDRSIRAGARRHLG